MFKVSRSRILKILTIAAVLAIASAFFIYRAGRPFAEVENGFNVPPITEENTIHFFEAPENVGETLWVKGVIDHVFVSVNGNHFLNFCPDFRECPFSAPIFAEEASMFEDIKSWGGREVFIYGKIGLYEGRPQIIIDHPERVVLGPAGELEDILQEVEVIIDGGELARVVNVIDGDTIWVEIQGVVESVRFLGIDAPETEGPYSDGECYGEEAKARLGEVLVEGVVVLMNDEEVSDRDRYGRLLRYVHLPDGTSVNGLMIEEGYAFVYVLEPFSMEGLFSGLETEAKRERRGFWSDECEYYFR